MCFKYLALLFIVSFHFLGCKIPINQASVEAKNVIIELEKTTCMGPCPAYILKIYENGYITLNAKENLDITGLHESFIAKKELDVLLANFDAIKFFELKNAYKSFMMDLPTKYISYTKNGQTKRIMAYDKIPPKLTLLINEIDSLTKTLSWTQLEK